MNKASLYQRVNNMQRQDAKCILKDYRGVMQWRVDGRDKLLDVGSGSGNVLMELVQPLLPEKFDALIGTDISEDMVDYANKLYAADERTEFKVLDIAADKLPSDMCGQFDHVTSFYCLHWVQNQRTALSNIYNLLRSDGGDCLLAFLVKHPVFLVYQMLYEMPKWRRYMQDVHQFMPPLFNSADPKADYGYLLQEAGFDAFTVELRDESFVYEGLDDVKDNLKAVNPFLERIPKSQHDEYMNELMDVVFRLNLAEENNTGIKFKTQYQLAVVYARKCDGGFVNGAPSLTDRYPMMGIK